MKALAVLPFLIGILLLFIRPAEKVFLWLALPMLLAIPTYYYFPLPGLPDLNFFHFSILPLFVWWIKNGIKKYKFDLLDLLVFFYAGICIVSEFSTMGMKDGINIIIDRFVQIIIPFLLTKHFFGQAQLRVPILKIMVSIGALLALFSPLEFKFDLAVVDILQWIWPERLRWPGWPRYGFVRTAAVYGHPIIAGMMWSFFALFAIWLHKQRVWRKTWLGYCFILLNLAGLAMSISRGPILGFLIGSVLLWAGWSKNRMIVFIFLLTCSLAILPPAISKFIEYASIDRFNAMTETQENVAYRKELIDNYIVEIKKKQWLGYGRNGMPVVNSQKSIDNQYIYIALMHGTIAMYLFVGMTLLAFLKMLSFGLRHTPDNATGQLAWLFASCAGSWLLTLATVWMGAQSEQMVFILLAMLSTLCYESEQAEIHTKERSTLYEWNFRNL